MESKLNFAAIETYAKAYSDKLLNEIYTGKEAIGGDEILKLPVNQVGLFILDNIYQSWALEAEKLESSYFNYQAEDVKTSMKKLMNALSNNILVERDDLAPLLFSAVRDTLLLAISPYDFYSNLLKLEGTSTDMLNEKRKFIKINDSVLKKILEKLADSPALINEPDTLLDDVFGSLEEGPQDNEAILNGFAKLQPMTAEDFYITDRENPVIKPFAADDELDEEETEATLNASFMGNSYETVADKLKNNQQSGSLKSMLSINQKFMFINDLFDGNQDDFTKVLEFLEACETKEAAISFIQSNYLKHNIWKENSPQVKEFMILLDNKFN